MKVQMEKNVLEDEVSHENFLLVHYIAVGVHCTTVGSFMKVEMEKMY